MPSVSTPTALPEAAPPPPAASRSVPAPLGRPTPATTPPPAATTPPLPTPDSTDTTVGQQPVADTTSASSSDSAEFPGWFWLIFALLFGLVFGPLMLLITVVIFGVHFGKLSFSDSADKAAFATGAIAFLLTLPISLPLLLIFDDDEAKKKKADDATKKGGIPDDPDHAQQAPDQSAAPTINGEEAGVLPAGAANGETPVPQLNVEYDPAVAIPIGATQSTAGTSGTGVVEYSSTEGVTQSTAVPASEPAIVEPAMVEGAPPEMRTRESSSSVARLAQTSRAGSMRSGGRSVARIFVAVD